MGRKTWKTWETLETCETWETGMNGSRSEPGERPGAIGEGRCGNCLMGIAPVTFTP